jgi:hypothetical protein
MRVASSTRQGGAAPALSGELAEHAQPRRGWAGPAWSSDKVTRAAVGSEFAQALAAWLVRSRGDGRRQGPRDSSGQPAQVAVLAEHVARKKEAKHFFCIACVVLGNGYWVVPLWQH